MTAVAIVLVWLVAALTAADLEFARGRLPGPRATDKHRAGLRLALLVAAAGILTVEAFA